MFLIQAGFVNWAKVHSMKKLYEAKPNHWSNIEIKKSEKIALEHLILPFILLGVGSTASMLVFACEILWAKCKCKCDTTKCNKYGARQCETNTAQYSTTGAKILLETCPVIEIILGIAGLH